MSKGKHTTAAANKNKKQADKQTKEGRQEEQVNCSIEIDSTHCKKLQIDCTATLKKILRRHSRLESNGAEP